MKHRRKLFPLVAMAACFSLALTTAYTDDDPIRRGQGRGGGTSEGQKQAPPRQDPPQRQNPPQRQDPPRRQDPPKREDPGQREFPRQNPPQRQDPPRRQDPPKREDPGQREIPRQDPPRRQDPPKREDPPQRQDPPRRQDPPKREDPGQREIPRQDPPRRQDPPKREDPGQREIPRQDPPRRQDPPKRENPVNRGGGVVPRGDTGSQSGSNVRQNRGSMEELLRRKNGSRSGSVKYDSNSNRSPKNSSPLNIDRVPFDVRKGSMGNMVRRSDEIRVGSTRIRFGYNHYDSRWCDDYFYYPHYVFDPYNYNSWSFSPWYYYPQLPPYFNSTRCYFPTSYLWTPFYGVRYTWRQPSREYWNRDYNELDYVIEDIQSAFVAGDRRAIDRLTPRRGNVAIVMDGRLAYYVRPEDFYDTMLDAVENTYTRDYKILDVQYRRDAASVFARHEFDDPWGRRIAVYHYFKLETEGRDWVIREFGTSNNRW